MSNRSIVSPASSPKTWRKRVGLSVYEEQKLKARLRETAPSEPWVEAQIKAAEGSDPQGKPVVHRYHDPKVFPPGGRSTAMVACIRCNAFNPPQTVEEGVCLDHAEHTGWGQSPSAIAIAALQHYNLRLEESELPPESTAALRKEILEAGNDPGPMGGPWTFDAAPRKRGRR